jgi:hypothetical protein
MNFDRSLVRHQRHRGVSAKEVRVQHLEKRLGARSGSTKTPCAKGRDIKPEAHRFGQCCSRRNGGYGLSRECTQKFAMFQTIVVLTVVVMLGRRYCCKVWL